MSPLVPIPIILKGDSAECGGEFRTTFRTIPAFVRLVRNSKPNVDGVANGVSLHVWNAKRRFLERLALIRTVRPERRSVFIRVGGTL